ncbi:MAG TPA: hypothetical protein VEX68_14795 [Bryobacteraceae bacterium]|nr:hypothetical protein [Bryobacteraceae bacterium]
MNKDGTGHWLNRCLEEEKKRQSEVEGFRAVAGTLGTALSVQLLADLYRYELLFPEERRFIEMEQKAGASTIVRTGHAVSSGIVKSAYPIQQPAVKFWFDYHPNIVLSCTFDHRGDLDREFSTIVRVDAAPAFEAATIEEISEYLLKPILFDSLLDETK